MCFRFLHWNDLNLLYAILCTNTFSAIIGLVQTMDNKAPLALANWQHAAACCTSELPNNNGRYIIDNAVLKVAYKQRLQEVVATYQNDCDNVPPALLK